MPQSPMSSLRWQETEESSIFFHGPAKCLSLPNTIYLPQSCSLFLWLLLFLYLLGSLLLPLVGGEAWGVEGVGGARASRRAESMTRRKGFP